MFFGEQEYEGMGPGQSCGTYSFIDNVLRDSDGDIIAIKNIIAEGNDDVTEEEEEEEEDEEEEYVPPDQGRRAPG